ncbi:transcription factor grauzone-like [Topomyia yanbarensis]|uniref:transcription factor grauzone-like n=1 Tax=Topomyia yanbarensis TaxID=2498891 RepID=UPI00273C39F7|nr:transcription factor grauzone-like [Topomyia yanbarensis]XP_058833734.1 transcription factor grauzone-like [Topomyia yanbarensis]
MEGSTTQEAKPAELSANCFTCFRRPQDALSITKDHNVSDLLMKHFWFQLQDFNDDQIICHSCWDQLKCFHSFYCLVQHNYELLKNPATVRIKQEPSELEVSSHLVEVELKSFPPSEAEEFKPECISDDEQATDCSIKSEPLADSSSEKSPTISAAAKPKRKYTRRKNVEERKQPKPINYQIKTAEQLAEEDEIIRTHVRYICETCGTDCPSFNNFLKHVMDHHGAKGFIVCCGRRYYKKVRLLEHVQQLENPELFKCDICFKSFINSLGIRRHKQEMHLPDELRIYGCERCPKRFAKQSQLAAHLKGHENLDNATAKCEVCGKTFPSEALLKTHVKIRHTRPTDFICDVCAKGFYSKAEFLRHKKQHDLSPAELRVQCDVCQQWLKNRVSWRKHYIRHSQGPTTCDLCGHVSPNKSALAGHKRHRHRESIHTCQECGKEFRRAINLREHMASHTGEALYSCSFCERTFNSNANMFSHRKKMHPQEWLEMKSAQRVAHQGVSAVGGSKAE